MVVGLSGFGVIPLVLGDLKPDQVETIKALGGQVIQLGHGRGYLNVLDPGEATDAIRRLRAAGFTEKAAEVAADAHNRRYEIVMSLLSIVRSSSPSHREGQVVDSALKYLDSTFDGVPVLSDLLRVIQEGPEVVRKVALDRGDRSRYEVLTEELEVDLAGLINGGSFGSTFARQTTNPMRRDAPVVYDVSSIDDAEMELQAAALLACWSSGFGTVNVAHALADVGLEPRRHYFVVLDELWRALRVGHHLVKRVDALTRLNRQRGVGMVMVSHTMSDLLALADPEDQMIARGFVERAGMVICGGLPQAEMPLLTQAQPMSQAEQEMLQSWQDPPAWSTRDTQTAAPGQGRFLVKVGGRPGIPIKLALTETEIAGQIHDTSKLWHEASRVGRRDAEEGVS